MSATQINTKLPSNYRAFSKLEFCGNTLEMVEIPIVMSGEIPLLVGRGDYPMIWIKGPVVADTNKGPAGWVDLVSANKSAHPMISVIHPSQNQTIVSIKETIVIDCYSTDAESAVVKWLDLRPIGLVVYGNLTNLTFGMQHFYKNTFRGVTVAFGYKSSPPKSST